MGNLLAIGWVDHGKRLSVQGWLELVVDEQTGLDGGGLACGLARSRPLSAHALVDVAATLSLTVSKLKSGGHGVLKMWRGFVANSAQEVATRVYIALSSATRVTRTNGSAGPAFSSPGSAAPGTATVIVEKSCVRARKVRWLVRTLAPCPGSSVNVTAVESAQWAKDRHQVSRR